jgi:selenocysteine-specific elongation factor
VIHRIVGTAGHVDHGKTALVKALTGTDCDTHEEEKRRGITINLGFAHLALPSGDVVGVIDVPGHRDFVHTMAAGAHGIDVVLLVIAADEGVMPQTREHLRICEALGVSRGVIALSKADLVDEPALAAARARAAAFAQGTFLDGCAIVPVSAVSGRGIPELAAALAGAVASSPEKAGGGVFRMYIDRIFSVSGFGTVVTGSVIGGSLASGAAAWLLPDGKELRVRRMERYGAETNEVTAGDRASLNLAGLSREEFRRGMLVADRWLSGSTLFDAAIRLFPETKPLSVWSQATLIMGTFEAQVRVHLMDANSLLPGGRGLAQIHLPSPCVAQAKDAFVLRASSGDVTIGGGTIIDPHPLHHRKRPPGLVDRLRGLSGGSLAVLAAAETAKHPAGIERGALAGALNVSPADIDAIDASDFPGGMVVLDAGEKRFYVAPERFDDLAAGAKKNIAAFHAANPLVETGRTVEEMQGILGAGRGEDGRTLCLLVLERLAANGALRRAGRTYALPGHSVNLTAEERAQCRVVEDYILHCGMQAPVPADLAARAKRAGIDEKRLSHLLRFMTDAGVLHAVEGTHLHASVVDRCRDALRAELSRRPEGITVARFRDLVSGNRKICLMLFALFDAEGVTERAGDVRVAGPARETPEIKSDQKKTHHRGAEDTEKK